MTQSLRIAVLVDLPRTPSSGGHVKCWERLARAAADSSLPLDLTVYFSGVGDDEYLSETVRYRYLPPLFSTAKLTFLPYMPDKTDLSPWHPALAKELPQYDLVHTTDGFFAFAQTAARVCRKKGIPLVTSFHTDTPSYARIFTKSTIEFFTGRLPWLRSQLLGKWKLHHLQEKAMQRKLAKHVAACRQALVTRPEDEYFAEKILGEALVKPLRLGVDKDMFGTHKADYDGVLRDYGIPPDHMLALFVGRVDIGKNIHTLIEAAEKIIANGVPLHVIIAGVGPAEGDVRRRLDANATLLGYVKPEELARLYASVDVLTLTSEVEIRSMVGGEALVSGCPVLVSEKSNIAPLYNNTPAMRVIKSGVENWVEALSEFLSNAEMQASMRQAAVAYADHFLARWEDVLTEDLFTVWQAVVHESQNKVT